MQFLLSSNLEKVLAVANNSLGKDFNHLSVKGYTIITRASVTRGLMDVYMNFGYRPRPACDLNKTSPQLFYINEEMVNKSCHGKARGRYKRLKDDFLANNLITGTTILRRWITDSVLGTSPDSVVPFTLLHEWIPNKLHTTEILVADITFVFLFHNKAEQPQQRDGQKSPPSEYRENGETD